MKPIISLLFLYWNAPLWTLTSLESISKYMDVDFEIIVVNNGSEKQLTEDVEKAIIKLRSNNKHCVFSRVINNDKNLGVSKGFNTGIPFINPETKYISFFCNDWAITPHWAKNMIATSESNPRYGMLTSCTNWGAGSMMASSINPVKWRAPLWIEPDNPLFWKRIEEVAEKQNLYKNAVSPNKFVCMGFFVKKACFNDVGLFDENINTANDVWFTRVAGKYGWLSMTAWGAYIQHGYHQSFKQINDINTYNYIKPLEKADYIYMAQNERCN